MTSDLPSQHRALVLESTETGFELKKVTTPQATIGSAVVNVLEAGLLSYNREVYNGGRHYAYPKPLVGGCSAIARVASVGPDSVALKVGQLVYVDCVVRGRDDPSVLFLSAINEGYTDGSRKLMRDVWRDGTFAEFAKVPLENCIPLNEARLCQELGYSFRELMYMCFLIVPYGGLRDIKLEPGETVVVCPATGNYGSAGVQVAVALGAKVIAMARNEKELARLKAHVEKGTPGASIEIVKITGDEATDTAALRAFGTIDAVLDMSSPAASKSSHLTSAINTLRRNGRCSLMGCGHFDTCNWDFLGRSITLKAKLMYEREDVLQFVKILERGLFPKGKELVNAKSYGLADWKEAFDEAAEYTGIGRIVVLTP